METALKSLSATHDKQRRRNISARGRCLLFSQTDFGSMHDLDLPKECFLRHMHRFRHNEIFLQTGNFHNDVGLRCSRFARKFHYNISETRRGRGKVTVEHYLEVGIQTDVTIAKQILS